MTQAETTFNWKQNSLDRVQLDQTDVLIILYIRVSSTEVK